MAIAATTTINRVSATIAEVAALVTHLRTRSLLTGIDASPVLASLIIPAIDHAIPLVTTVAISVAAGLDTIAQALGQPRRALTRTGRDATAVLAGLIAKT